jgi:hypothetical protein
MGSGLAQLWHTLQPANILFYWPHFKGHVVERRQKLPHFQAPAATAPQQRKEVAVVTQLTTP